MAHPLNLTQAAKLVGVSRNTLYAAIRGGRLLCTMGGRPGTKTLVTLEALHEAGFSVPQDMLEAERIDERSHERPTRSERAEHSQRPERPERAERQEMIDVSGEYTEFRHTFEQFERAVERLERSMDSMADRIGERLERSVERALERALERVVERLLDRRAREALPAIQVRPLAEPSADLPSPRSTILARLHAMQGEGLSLQTMATRLNAEGVPTLSGRGRWQKGTIANLLAQGR